MKTGIVVQARMTSSRLPGKILMPAAGKPLLEIQIERLRRIDCVDQLVIATTTLASDDPVVALCDRLGVPTFRGSEDDVLSRYHGAATRFGLDTVVRVTADCPMIDPRISSGVIRHFQQNRDKLDYCSNTLTRSYPRGLDTEVFRFEALAQAHREAVAGPEREHVTLFIYRRPERFRLQNLPSPVDLSHNRWTVDEPADYELVSRMINALYPANPDFGLEDGLALLREHPDWPQINEAVRQKQV